jgi:glycosyltransferase involved in cell wall biosynthesis
MTDQVFNAGRPKVLIVIPAFNEAGRIRETIEDLHRCAPWADAVVIDDGSIDDTAAIAAGAGAIVLRLPFNLGVGGAMRTGYRYAHDRSYDLAVQFDGDGQHRADHVSRLLAAVAEGADLAVGSRVLDKGGYRFPFMRKVGSLLIAAVICLVTGKRFTDPTSGFRAANRRMIAFFARHYPEGYLGDTVEALFEAARHGMDIREVPVEMRPAEHSSIGSLKGLFHTACICLAILIDRLERKFPDSPAPTGQASPTTPKARDAQENHRCSH